MEFGQIIKKAWTITWRYRFLWVLALFAGVTGAGGGGGGNFNSGRSFSSGGTGSTSGGQASPFSAGGLQRLGSTAEHWIPVIVGLALLWILVALVFWVLSIAARGSLVWAVNELEEGRRPSLGAAWGQGFSRFWSIFGLGLLLQLPLLIAVLLLAAAIIIPIALAVASGGRGVAAAIVPVCGSLAIGVPLVIVMGFVLGIMYVIGLRRIVLDGIGAIQSAGDAWRTFRSRFKDTALMWLINWGLNVAAALVLAIPVIIVTIVFVVPVVFAGIGENWGVLAVLAGIWLLVIVILSLLFRAIWGTFTSALWTILYRRLTGREVVVPSHPHAAHPVPPGPIAAPSYPAPTGYPGSPPGGYAAPPVQGWPPPPPPPPVDAPSGSPPPSPEQPPHE